MRGVEGVGLLSDTDGVVDSPSSSSARSRPVEAAAEVFFAGEFIWGEVGVVVG